MWAGGSDVQHQLRELVPLLITIVDELGLTHTNDIHSERGPSTTHPCLEKASEQTLLGWFIRGTHHQMHKDLKVVLICGRNRRAGEIALALQDARITLPFGT